MNLKHLGDALDHWKGSVIELIGDKKLRVVPMFTDHEPWPQPHLDTYAKLLRREPEDILKKGVRFSKNSRDAYFSNLGKEDLFLDPDTGIASEENAKEKHVKPSEIAILLEESGSRMLLIYQHRLLFRRDGFREKLNLLRSTVSPKDCPMFAYDSGTVSMVVISQSQKRIKEASERIHSCLGLVASARIIQ
jgi:hypothetical protein